MMRYVAEDLIEGEGATAVLIGGRSKNDGRVVFPWPAGRDRDNFDRFALQREGTLWSWTVQRFPPKSPYDGPGQGDGFTPYAVGYVELPGQVIVEARIVVDDFARLAIGMPMSLTTEAYRVDADGPVLTYAFAPT